MKKTKINGYPGFGIPSDMGETGESGNNVYFVDRILYEPVKEDEIIGDISTENNIITYEYYYGKETEGKNIIKFHVCNKPEGYSFKDGDTLIVNIDRCCFYDIITVGDDENKKSFIKNEPKYKLTLSPIKQINFSFTVALTEMNGSLNTLTIYPSLLVENENIIKDFHVELIQGNKKQDYRISVSDMSTDSTMIKIPSDFPRNNGKQATVNIYAVCRTHTMGCKEYFLKSEKVGI